MLKTKLCDLAGIKHPIIQGGMGPWKTDDLAVAVAGAGALGIISMGPIVMDELSVPDPPGAERIEGTPAERVRKYIKKVQESTRAGKGIFGVNYLVSSEIAKPAKIGIEAALNAREEDPDLKERLRVLITSAGDPLPLAEVVKPSGIKWFHVVPSVRHAKRAEKAGVDAVIASGQEGGGHVAWEPVHSIVLIPAVVKAVKIPVIAAGGFCDGAGLVASLALGACGIQMGTRFVATRESGFVDMWKQMILKSEERDTLYARGFSGPLRYLKNKKSIELGGMTLKKSPRLYLGEADASLDPEVWAFERDGFEKMLGEDEEQALFFGGEVAGRIHDIPSVAELVSRITREAEEIIPRLAEFIKRLWSRSLRKRGFLPPHATLKHSIY